MEAVHLPDDSQAQFRVSMGQAPFPIELAYSPIWGNKKKRISDYGCRFFHGSRHQSHRMVPIY